jgi:hypothetical protein
MHLISVSWFTSIRVSVVSMLWHSFSLLRGREGSLRSREYGYLCGKPQQHESRPLSTVPSTGSTTTAASVALVASSGETSCVTLFSTNVFAPC